MDKKVASNLTVGIFVTIGFAVFVFIVFSIGDGKGIFGSQLNFYGKFSEVKGLHQGSEVSLNGLRVGVVKKITVSTENRELIVSMAVDKAMSEQIRQDTVAMVKTQGVLGDKYIELTIGSAGEPLKDGAFIPTGSAPDIFSKGGNIMDELSLQFQKGGNVNQVLSNLNSTTQNLANITAGLQKGKTSEKLDKSMAHLESILAKIDSGEGTLGALVNDPSIYEDIRAMLGGAKRSNVLKYFMRSFIEDGQKKKEK